MQQELVQPFIDATVDTFVTMLGAEPKVVNIQEVRPPFDQENITAVIGLSGDGIGLCAVGFSEATTMKVVEEFTGELPDDIDDEVYDAVGEIINIIAGAAKAGLGGLKIMISLPSIMHGSRFRMALPKKAEITKVDFEMPGIGEMTLLVSLKPQ